MDIDVKETTTTTPQAQENNTQPNVVVKQGETITADVVNQTDVVSEAVDGVHEEPQETTEQPNEDAGNLAEDMQKQKTAESELAADLQDKGVDFDAIAKEYENNGSLSADTMEQLNKAGYPKSVVDMYIKGMESVAERFVSNVKSMAGGEEGFKQLSSFIQTQPKEVIDAFNATINGGNLPQIQMAISGLQSQMVKTYGTANPTFMAGAAGAGTPAGYTSVDQMTKDMSDPRYQVDPQFTREVVQKVKNATFF